MEPTLAHPNNILQNIKTFVILYKLTRKKITIVNEYLVISKPVIYQSELIITPVIKNEHCNQSIDV